MSEMDKLVARAIKTARFTMSGHKGNPEDFVVDDQDRLVARAAIMAMREPTNWRIDTETGRAIRARRRPAYIAVCRQTDCFARGFNEADCGNCAACADIGDDVIESYWRAMIDTLNPAAADQAPRG